MSQTVRLQVVGSALAAPASSVTPGPTLQASMRTNIDRVYTQEQPGRFSIVGATDLLPYVVPLGTVTKVRYLLIQIIPGTGSVVAKLTSAAGALQKIPVGEKLEISSPLDSDQLTVIQLTGTADGEILIVGD
jgi:hypothetical protein